MFSKTKLYFWNLSDLYIGNLRSSFKNLMLSFKMKLRNLICIALFSLTPFVASAENPDVENFKVSGVQLGMPLPEAIDVLVTHYSISADDFVVTMYPDRFPVIGNIEMVEKMTYDSPQLSVILVFSPDIDKKDDGYMVVEKVTIVDGSTTFQEKLDFAIEEYGPESFIRKGSKPEKPDTWHYHWCGQTKSSGKSCDFSFGGLALIHRKFILESDAYYKKFKEVLRQQSK